MYSVLSKKRPSLLSLWNALIENNLWANEVTAVNIFYSFRLNKIWFFSFCHSRNISVCNKTNYEVVRHSSWSCMWRGMHKNVESFVCQRIIKQKKGQIQRKSDKNRNTKKIERKRKCRYVEKKWFVTMFFVIPYFHLVGTIIFEYIFLSSFFSLNKSVDSLSFVFEIAFT